MTLKLRVLTNFSDIIKDCSIYPNTWYMASEAKSTVYFEPDEDTHALVGKCLIEGLSINFIPFVKSVTVEKDHYAYFITHFDPRVEIVDGHRLITLRP